MEQSRPKWTGSSLQIFRRWSFRYRSLQHPLRQWWVPVSFYAFSMVSFQPIRHKACKYEINLANSKCALDLIASPPEPFDVGHLPRSIIPEHRVTKKQKQYPDRLERPGSTVQHAPFFSNPLASAPPSSALIVPSGLQFPHPPSFHCPACLASPPSSSWQHFLPPPC